MSSEPAGRGAPLEQTLDAGVLDELREVGGDELVHELMEVFIDRTPGRLRTASAGLAEGDLIRTARALHSLRSAAGTVGARRLVELAGELERAAHSGGVDEVTNGLAQLEREADEALLAARRLSATREA